MQGARDKKGIQSTGEIVLSPPNKKIQLSSMIMDVKEL